MYSLYAPTTPEREGELSLSSRTSASTSGKLEKSGIRRMYEGDCVGALDPYALAKLVCGFGAIGGGTLFVGRDWS